MQPSSAPSSNACSGPDAEPGLGLALLSHARAAIAEKLAAVVPRALEHAALDEAGATFVTLRQHESLRGCIGHLEATRPLRRDVRENAIAAAFRDPRFPPLSIMEWPTVELEVSLLGPVVMQPCASEADALAMLVPGEDGVLLSSGGRQATFLPQVWTSLPQPVDFLAQLKLKAGLHKTWPADMMLGRYRATTFVE